MTGQSVIHLIDDDPSFRGAVSRLLGAHGYLVITYASAKEYLADPASGRGCILLDVRMPGLSGLQAQVQLADQNNMLPIVFVSGHGDIPMSVSAIKAGAEDFLIKPVPAKRLLAAIKSALNRYDENRVQQDRLKELKSRFARLTPREAEVFYGVVAGKPNKIIAAELGTAERTIKAHRHKVMEKMEAPSLAELVDMARILKDG